MEHGEISNQERIVLEWTERKNDYCRKYGSGLPEPSPETEVITVIPALAELSNDGFWRLLRSVSVQTEAGRGKFEILYVVPNRDTDIDTEEYSENQSHLRLIRELNNQQKDHQINETSLREVRPDISEWELEVARKYITSNARLLEIDASSPGSALHIESKTDGPTGIARDIGASIAYDRFEKLAIKNGFIDFLDGDCYVPRDYYEEIIRYRHEGKKVIQKPLVSFPVDIPTWLKERSSEKERVLSIVDYLSSTWVKYLWTSMLDDFDFETCQYPSEGFVGGPQMTVTAEKYRDIGGYTYEKRDQDYSFSSGIMMHSNEEDVAVSEAAKVYIADRGRKSSHDGLRTGIYRAEKPDDDIYKFRENVLSSELDRVKQVISQHESRLAKEIDAVSDRYGWDRQEMWGEYLSLRRERFNEEKLKKNLFIDHAKKIIEAVCEKVQNNPNIRVEDLNNKLDLNKRESDFLNRNPVYLELLVFISKDAMREISEQGNTFDLSDMTLDKLIYLLPEYFKEPPKTELTADEVYRNPEYNLRDSYHVQKAVFEMRSRLRDRITIPVQ